MHSVSASTSGDYGGWEEDSDTHTTDASYLGGDRDSQDAHLSYGEELVLGTCVRSRARPWSKRRHAELAKPKRREFRHGSPLPGIQEVARGVEETARLQAQPASRGGRSKVQALVARLSQPKLQPQQEKPPTAAAGRVRQAEVDVPSMVARLATPRRGRWRVESPLLAHRAPAVQGRTFNKERAEELAKPRRRIGSTRAWGVRPPSEMLSLTTFFPDTSGGSRARIQPSLRPLRDDFGAAGSPPRTHEGSDSVSVSQTLIRHGPPGDPTGCGSVGSPHTHHAESLPWHSLHQDGARPWSGASAQEFQVGGDARSSPPRRDADINQLLPRRSPRQDGATHCRGASAQDDNVGCDAWPVSPHQDQDEARSSSGSTPEFCD